MKLSKFIQFAIASKREALNRVFIMQKIPLTVIIKLFMPKPIKIIKNQGMMAVTDSHLIIVITRMILI